MTEDERQELQAQRTELEGEMREVRRWIEFWSDRFTHSHVGQPIGSTEKSLISELDALLQTLIVVREWIDQRMTEEAQDQP
jgi:hypothetical protein